MRLWSLDPSLLDRQGLTAAWREALLAQKVLAGGTRGYVHHPQLVRFRATAAPLSSMAVFLDGIADAAAARGYAFDRSRILDVPRTAELIDVSEGQVAFEWAHLMAKLAVRSPELRVRLTGAQPTVHRLFRVVRGGVAGWERAAGSPTAR
ncbi:pyrimidine dimer DNA glycosylase/endonuclease V [Tessaracoccus lubricantis]|uniref:Pyrimidine dimer DNA glycosylase/endonuclease V n=1 Tax=Tessaracoccus lubricantis TaxID=545543 RepID=A0ABP9F8X1_9ACTN